MAPHPGPERGWSRDGRGRGNGLGDNEADDRIITRTSTATWGNVWTRLEIATIRGTPWSNQSREKSDVISNNLTLTAIDTGFQKAVGVLQ